MAGLSTGHNLRLVEPEEPPEGVEVEIANDDQGPQPEYDDKGNILRLAYPDGSIEISTNGEPLNPEEEDQSLPGWYGNLVTRINELELSIIADDLLRGINEDLQNRAEWVQQRTDGIRLLGLKLETPNTGDSADGAAVEGMSRVRHPVMLAACLQFQANFRGEMLPTDGPVKIRNDDTEPTTGEDDLADDFEKDLNHYLTTTATEFYPDTDRMGFEIGFSGLGIKKVYYCPLRNRPVSEMVDSDDLIVNADATDLQNALRVTHRIMMRPAVVRRMQILSIYRDVQLGTPNPPAADSLKQEKQQQQGVQSSTTRPEDREREIYECYCEYDIKGFEHSWKGKPSGLAIPWRITIDVTSRQILSVVRNYEKPGDDNDLPIAEIPFVDYQFVPAFGFYPIGLLHIMGNMTNAVTAAWREMLDMGMFANFPGFLYTKQAGRQNSLIFRVPPGGGAPVETGGLPIRDQVMPLPYNAQGMPALFQLQQDITTQAEKVGQISQIQVAEGRADVPVGTTLAMIEQAQKLLSAVHKRNHSSQGRELQKIAKCFKQHPQSFWQGNRKPARQWNEQTFLRALNDVNLVPQSDPNTATHLQRLMKVAALSMLQQQDPRAFDPVKMSKLRVRALGYRPEDVLAPDQAMTQPSPEQQQMVIENQTKQAESQAKLATAQAQAQKAQADVGLASGRLQMDQQNSDVDNKVKIVDTQLKHAIGAAKLYQDQDKNLVAEEVQLVDAAQNLTVHPDSAPLVAPLIQPAFEDVKRRQAEHRSKTGGGLGLPPPEF